MLTEIIPAAHQSKLVPTDDLKSGARSVRGALSQDVPIGDQDRFLRPQTLSRYLDIPVGTLAYWRMVGIGPQWHKFEGRIRYYVADVIRFINQTRRVPSVRAALEEKHVSL
jgi:hypothetical protein